MRTRSSLLLVAAAVFALVTVGLTSAAMAQKVSGAIFTTDQCSNFVDGNVYDAASTTTPHDDCAQGKGNYPTAPYLNGGPRPNAPCDAAGLPSDPVNGTDYYFQVTDPSGSLLLTVDSIEERRVHVFQGLIVAYLGSTRTTGIGKCGNITAQLYPFTETPNPGGEYKAWMTPVNSYDPTQGFHGFIPSQSKTDNFKVIGDTDADGFPDSEDACPNESAPESPDGCPPPIPPAS